MIRIRWNGTWLDFGEAEWSGSDTQCSRELAFTLPRNPYDKDFYNPAIKLGDLVHLYEDKKLLFVGTVTARGRSAAIGTVSYTAQDFMHHLLRSNGSYKFQNTTAEKIAEKICRDFKLPRGKFARTKYNIVKMIFDDQCVYDILIKAYRTASAKTRKKYMPKMDGKKVCVVEKGTDCNVILTQGIDITDAEYSDNLDNVVNRVNIYNDKGKRLGKVESKTSLEKYGVYQQTYKKDGKENAKLKAKSMLAGVSHEYSVSALGNTKAVSGRSITVKDKATGMTGKFYITNDTHTFSSGTHTMQLTLSTKNTMEIGADVDKKTLKKSVTNSAKCYYLDGSKVYHSSTDCTACKGKKVTKSTVADMKKIRLTSGKNKGKRKYKPCSRCWNV